MSSFFTAEVCKPAFEHKQTPMLSYGLPFPEACAKHVGSTFKASRVLIIVSKSIATNTSALGRLQNALGTLVVSIRVGISAHTPISECVDIINQVEDHEIDCIITLGAGSITDGAKLIRFALANGALTQEAVNSLWGGRSHNPEKRANINQPTIPLISIPTSLSGGEYSSIAGATDDLSRAKRIFEPGVTPDLVIQDPELCQTTPQHVWLSSGVRSIDHCVEALCSLESKDEVDKFAERGLCNLIEGLLVCKAGSADLHAYHRCQLGVVDAMQASTSGVPMGASHAIGHQLGPLSIGHGETSCILLPAVCKFNAIKRVNHEKQQAVAEKLMGLSVVQELIGMKGLQRENLELSDILDVVIRQLGMPRTLAEVGVGRDKLDLLAENSLHDPWITTNPFPITKKDQVLDILEMVVG
ncbi:uncharacterized protein N7479_005364 [Penicillium vulpinum]|uniref:Uncharacterized protein n=1 Tax=Penicillium vulpinum TaxID=29845 RepID=A0A1V6RL77_9EURO|nr:uncharacterized protein N7479_005364 [Penicillium vulpinum]KAJ5958214.1 hypothetical protein N7479_005364 [Penicillium vulpinum]OQE02204.1 hypothetical protein PENVUL_c040G00124 [Penicillium vulpinum]